MLQSCSRICNFVDPKIKAKIKLQFQISAEAVARRCSPKSCSGKPLKIRDISLGDFQNIVSVSATKNNGSEFAPRYYLSVCFYRNNFVSLMPGINPWKCKYTYIFVNFKTKTISYIFFYVIKDPKKISHVLSTRSPLLQILKFLIFITDPESNFVTDFKFLCLATIIFEKENVSDYRTPTLF